MCIMKCCYRDDSALITSMTNFQLQATAEFADRLTFKDIRFWRWFFIHALSWMTTQLGGDRTHALLKLHSIGKCIFLSAYRGGDDGRPCDVHLVSRKIKQQVRKLNVDTYTDLGCFRVKSRRCVALCTQKVSAKTSTPG